MTMNEAYNCYLDIPYPTVTTQGRNTAYAALLSNDLAGQVSEMTAVTQYIFQHVISVNEKISKVMQCISIVEMRHYEFLSELIRDFGGNPKIAVQNGCSQVFWNAQYVDYCCDPKIFLKNNITAETAAITNYTRRIGQICDNSARAVLERIILDEEHHRKIFYELLAEICG
ncbi:MAG: bacterioferritin [Clostridia bacterium]|nr:bacterioferritin [Clostridia bacterium]